MWQAVWIQVVVWRRRITYCFGGDFAPCGQASVRFPGVRSGDAGHVLGLLSALLLLWSDPKRDEDPSSGRRAGIRKAIVHCERRALVEQCFGAAAPAEPRVPGVDAVVEVLSWLRAVGIEVWGSWTPGGYTRAAAELGEKEGRWRMKYDWWSRHNYVPGVARPADTEAMLRILNGVVSLAEIALRVGTGAQS